MSRTAPRTAYLVRAALLAAVVSLAPTVARAAPPTGVATLEDILVRARTAKAEAKAAAESAKRNPVLERINKYRDGVTPLKSFEYLTDIVRDSKNDSTAPYRVAAARALVDRFSAEGTNDVLKRKVRREIGLELVSLMKAPSSDKVGLSAVTLVFKAWWGKQLQSFGFDPGGKYRDRSKACREMSSYLKRRGN